MGCIEILFGRRGIAAVVRMLPFAATLASIVLWTAPASAQGPGISETDTFVGTLVFNPASVTTTQVNLYSTQVLGRLNGGTVYDQAFAVAAGDAAVQTAFNAARLRVTNAGGPSVIVGPPHLISSSSNTTSVSTSVYSLAGTSSTPNVVVTFGPAPITIGTISTCSVGGLPSATRPTCTNVGGTPYQVGDNETNFNTVTTTTHTINTTTTTTNTTTLAEVWAMDGTVQAVGTSYTAINSGAYDLTSRFMRRLGDEDDDETNVAVGTANAPVGFAATEPSRFSDLPPELLAYASTARNRSSGGRTLPAELEAPLSYAAPRYRGWAEGYGLWSQTRAQGAVPGDDRRASGLAGGFSYRVLPTLTLGLAVDQGWQNVTLASASESGRLYLTQFGATAAYRNGPWLANAVASFGFGDATASRDLPGLSARAAYQLRTAGVFGEAGYKFRYGNFRIVPKVGFDFTSVDSGGFMETGVLALTAPAYQTDRTRVWGGVEISQRLVPTPTSVVDLSAYGRIIGVVSGDTQSLPVSFVGIPGAPLAIQGGREGDALFSAGGRVIAALTPNASVFGRYDGQFRDGFRAHALSGGLKISW